VCPGRGGHGDGPLHFVVPYEKQHLTAEVDLHPEAARPRRGKGVLADASDAGRHTCLPGAFHLSTFWKAITASQSLSRTLRRRPRGDTTAPPPSLDPRHHDPHSLSPTWDSAPRQAASREARHS
jgi:hypothetical protein